MIFGTNCMFGGYTLYFKNEEASGLLRVLLENCQVKGKDLAAERVRRDFTQMAVARKIGVSRQHYNKVERGTNKLSIQAWIALADLFNFDVSDIIKLLVLPENPYKITVPMDRRNQ